MAESTFIDGIRERQRQSAEARHGVVSEASRLARHNALVAASQQSAHSVVESVKEAMQPLSSLATSEDTQAVTAAVVKLESTTARTGKESSSAVVAGLEDLAQHVDEVTAELSKLREQRVTADQAAAAREDPNVLKMVTQLQAISDGIRHLRQKDDAKVVQGLDRVASAVKRIDVKPVVNVPATKVTVEEREVDLSPLLEQLEAVNASVNRLKDAQPTFNSEPITQGLAGVETAVRDLIAKPVPVPTNSPPFLDASGKPARVQLDSAGNLPTSTPAALVTEDHDYISAAYPNATTETYTFKAGGSGGATVATVTVVYTDSTKVNVSSVTRS